MIHRSNYKQASLSSYRLASVPVRVPTQWTGLNVVGADGGLYSPRTLYDI